MQWVNVSHLVHRQASVVEVAAASLETDFSHAVVNQKEVPQLQETQPTQITIKTVHFELCS